MCFYYNLIMVNTRKRRSSNGDGSKKLAKKRNLSNDFTSTNSKEEGNVREVEFLNLSREEQQKADWEYKAGQLQKGARIYAHFNGLYYPAQATGNSKVTSREVIFLDDKTIKYVPVSGIYRLNELTVETKVEVILFDVTGESSYFSPGMIVKCPSPDDINEFFDANYLVYLERKREAQQFHWTQICLSKGVSKNSKNLEMEIQNGLVHNKSKEPSIKSEFYDPIIGRSSERHKAKAEAVIKNSS
uniref:PH domain-containing protein n=1 Tax=Parastrongyloides trichosuri TaxID=131310 RepID=A0A0N4Z2J8_PARTI